MQIHRLVAFPAGVMFNKTRSTTFYLDLAVGSLLDMLHISTALADYLGAKVESRERFEVDGNSFFRPFSLQDISIFLQKDQRSQFSMRCASAIHTRPYSSRSTGSGASRRRKRRSSTRFGSSFCMRSFTITTAFSRPSLFVLVI